MGRREVAVVPVGVRGGNLLEKVGHHLRMGQKALKLVRRDLDRASR